ncbi:MAG: hypothetical protein QHG99_01545 [Methanomicrobiales archaeon]|nr:hypothetical protein [Methanomicrobiales archaeon]
MDFIKIIDELLGNSIYQGDFRYDELLKIAKSKKISGIALFGDQEQKFFLVFADGEPEGAIMHDPKGSLYGDKAAYRMSEEETYELFLVNPEIARGLASRCRIFDKSHVMKRLPEELPTIGGKRGRIGVMCISVSRDAEPVSGVRVSIRKGRQELLTDVTSVDGKVCFKLMNGRYDCVVFDRNGEMYPFMVDFKDQYAETEVDIGGSEGNEHA